MKGCVGHPQAGPYILLSGARLLRQHANISAFENARSIITFNRLNIAALNPLPSGTKIPDEPFFWATVMGHLLRVVIPLPVLLLLVMILVISVLEILTETATSTLQPPMVWSRLKTTT